jgi:hypothetical protein
MKKTLKVTQKTSFYRKKKCACEKIGRPCLYHLTLMVEKTTDRDSRPHGKHTRGLDKRNNTHRRAR